MRSAVVVARQKAEEEAAQLRQETSTEPDDISKVRVETDGAVFEGGKAFLKGNPLHTTKEIICPDCRLPRLLYPVVGKGARPPPDPYREYCQKQPPIIKPGCDVHGNPFATDKLNNKKKKQNTTNTPGSSPPTTPDGSSKQTVTEKVSFPTVKCPNCPRYFIVTRVAQHLDRCLGLSARSNRGKPQSDANNTSNASGPPKRPHQAADDENHGVKKKKKLGAPKKSAEKRPPSLPSKLKNGSTPDVAVGPEDGDASSEVNGDVN